MSTSVTGLSTNFFPSAENNFTTTTSGSVSSGAATVGLASVAGYSNGEVVVFVIDPTDATKKQTFTGVMDTGGSQVTSVVWTAGTNQTHALGATVVDYATATHISMISKGLLVEHNQAGGHTSITASGTLAVTGATTLTGALTIKSYDGWINTADTWTYATASTFTIAGVDRTAQFPVGTKIKLTQTTAKYFYVTASSFSTNTTVTVAVTTDYTIANAAITLPNYSYDATPQGFPTSFTWAGTVTGWAATPSPATKTFSMVGKKVYWIIDYSGTSNSTALTITAPVSQSSSIATVEGKCGLTVDNAAITNTGAWSLSSNTITFFVDNGRSNTWTSSGTKQLRAQGFYDAA